MISDLNKLFIDNTALLLSTVFQFHSKYCEADDIAYLKSSKEKNFCFSLEVENNHNFFTMFFFAELPIKKHMHNILIPLLQNLYGSSLYSEDNHEKDNFGKLEYFWYNVAAIFIYSFFDKLDIIKQDVTIKPPKILTKKEFTTHLDAAALSTVIGKSNMKNVLYISIAAA